MNRRKVVIEADSQDVHQSGGHTRHLGGVQITQIHILERNHFLASRLRGNGSRAIALAACGRPRLAREGVEKGQETFLDRLRSGRG